MPNNKIYNINDRTLEFAAQVARFINKLPLNQVTTEYNKQLIRSSASIGANLEEADGTLSKRDFINKVAISRREARESRYWLKLIKKADLIDNPQCMQEIEYLLEESEEIMLILSSIINKTKDKEADKQ
ncbi:MAG: four helix bundle protein [bacterium]